MGKFVQVLKLFDNFGEPIRFNFGGRVAFNTVFGAVLTLTIQIFILVFMLTQTSKLNNYKDPRVTQVSHSFIS